ncbi:hypothetical protein BJX99DRAFT_218132 [Aspergillus californicus]
MPWSVDTTVSFISLLVNGTSSLLDIWDHITSALRGSSQDSTSDPSISEKLRQPNMDPEVLLELGLFSPSDKSEPVAGLGLIPRAKSVTA